jgi:hypothetical protein
MPIERSFIVRNRSAENLSKARKPKERKQEAPKVKLDKKQHYI